MRFLEKIKYWEDLEVEFEKLKDQFWSVVKELKFWKNRVKEQELKIKSLERENKALKAILEEVYKELDKLPKTRIKVIEKVIERPVIKRIMVKEQDDKNVEIEDNIKERVNRKLLKNIKERIEERLNMYA